MNHKAGYVNIIGKPNVGKSTLMNALVGRKLSIVTHKAQTTRNRILSIINGENFQMVFSDTPGVIKPLYLLQKRMMNEISEALEDADIILFVTDVKDNLADAFDIKEVQETFKKSIDHKIPLVIALNKIDLLRQNDSLEIFVKTIGNEVKSRFADLSFEVVPISASDEINLVDLTNKLLALMPEAPAYFPKDEVSNLSERFFISEIIREKIFTQFKKEIPYSTQVVVNAFNDEKKIVKIFADIIVERESQKGILLGKKGAAIKKLGKSARIDIEEFLQKKVYLELFIKVRENWRNSDMHLKEYGF